MASTRDERAWELEYLCAAILPQADTPVTYDQDLTAKETGI